MRTEYSGYSIAIEAKQKNGGLWAAEVRIWPVHNRVRALRDQREVEGYNTLALSEDAGLAWARERIDAYAENRLPRTS